MHRIAVIALLLPAVVIAQPTADWSDTMDRAEIVGAVPGADRLLVHDGFVVTAGDSVVVLGDDWDVVGSVALPAEARRLLHVAGRAYVICGEGGLVKLHLDPTGQPSLSEVLPPGEDVVDLAELDDGLLVVGLASGTLYVLDLDHSLVATVEVGEDVDALAAQDGYVLVAEQYGLRPLDLTNLQSPVVGDHCGCYPETIINYFGDKDVVVAGDRAYFTSRYFCGSDHHGGSYICTTTVSIDLSDPMNPDSLAAQTAGPRRVLIAGDLVMAAGQSLWIGDRETFSTVAEIQDIGDTLADICVDGDHLFGIDNTGRIYDWSLVVPRTIQPAVSFAYQGEGTGEGRYRMVSFRDHSNSAWRHHVHDCSAEPELVYDRTGSNQLVAQIDDRLVTLKVVEEWPYIRCEDLDSGEAGSFPGINWAQVDGTVLWTVRPSNSDYWLEARDLSMPGFDPVGTLENLQFSWYRYDSGVCLAVREDIVAVDCSDPANPTIASVVAAGLNAFDFAGGFRGRLLYLATSGQFEIYDFHDPAEPVLRGSCPLEVDGVPVTIAIADDLAFISALSEWQIVSVADPDAPAPLSSPLPGRSAEFAASGTHLYVHEYSGMVHLYDISDPTLPTWVGQGTPHGSGSMYINDGRLFVGTAILPLDVDDPAPIDGDNDPIPQLLPAAVALHPVQPNPFNPRAQVRFELARAGQVEITVHDMRGRLVATLASESMGAGQHTLTWSGDDLHGQAVPSGAYLIRLRTEEVERSVKAMLVR